MGVDESGDALSQRQPDAAFAAAKREMARLAASEGAVDLSHDDLDSERLESTRVGLREVRHRVQLQQSAFNSIMALVAVMVMTAIGLSIVLMSMYSQKDGFDWHAALLVGGFLLPATIMSVGLLRATFPRDEEKHGGIELPSMQALKELREVFDTVFARRNASGD